MCFNKKIEEDALLKYYEAQVVRADQQSFAVHDYCLYVQQPFFILLIINKKHRDIWKLGFTVVVVVVADSY